MIPQEAEWEPCDDLKVRKEEKKNNSELVLEMAFLKPQGACKKQNKKKTILIGTTVTQFCQNKLNNPLPDGGEKKPFLANTVSTVTFLLLFISNSELVAVIFLRLLG